MTGKQSFHAVPIKPECPAEVKAETQPYETQTSMLTTWPP